MPELFEVDREKAKALLAELLAKIGEAAAGDEALRVQMKRYIGKRLEFDERGMPTHRRRLKAQKRESLCGTEGNTIENTSLVCARCRAKCGGAGEARMRDCFLSLRIEIGVHPK